MDITAGGYSLQMYDYLSQIQRETKAFVLIVRDHTEWPKISEWQCRHRTLFLFVLSQNRVNLVLSFEPCTFFVCFFVLFCSCCSHARVFGKTLVHEFPMFYSHTKWYLSFFVRLNSLFGPSFVYQIKLNLWIVKKKRR